VESAPEVEVAAVLHRLPSLEAAIAAGEPDFVLTDIRMPPSHTTRHPGSPSCCVPDPHPSSASS